jgi:hypothetical protein
MENKKKRDLNSTSENKPLQPIIKIGPHILSFIDKDIAKKLKIEEGDCVEQQITDDGNIVLKIQRIESI